VQREGRGCSGAAGPGVRCHNICTCLITCPVRCPATQAHMCCAVPCCVLCHAVQSPLQVLLRDSSLTLNSITGSLMWLRLVNTSMTGVNITHNLAMDPAAVAAAGTARGGGSSAAVADAATLVAQARRSLLDLQPPHLCDMDALDRALLQVQGPAAFDMLG